MVIADALEPIWYQGISNDHADVKTYFNAYSVAKKKNIRNTFEYIFCGNTHDIISIMEIFLEYQSS